MSAEGCLRTDMKSGQPNVGTERRRYKRDGSMSVGGRARKKNHNG